MSLTLIPLLIAALLLVSADSGVETVQLVLTGEREIVEQHDAMIIGDARVAIPPGAEIPGPIYVIGGELVVDGKVSGDLIQLAGTVRVSAGAGIAGELREIAGTLIVDDGAIIGRRTGLNLTAETSPGRDVMAQVSLAVLLALAGVLVARKRSEALGNVSSAAAGHPVITFTVGLLVTLTVISLLVFMAFTLVLIPVALLGIVAGLVVLAYGVISWGHLIGSRLPIRQGAPATGLGVLVALVVMRLVGLIPLIGDALVAGLLLTGVGAVLVTYFGITRFRPDPLPD